MGATSTLTRTIPARPAGAVEGEINGLVARDPARERRPAPPLGDLAPLPAREGIADWGTVQAAGGA